MKFGKTLTALAFGTALTFSINGCKEKEVSQVTEVSPEVEVQRTNCEPHWLFHGEVDKYSLEQRKQILIINGEDPSLYDSTCITNRAEKLLGGQFFELNIQATALQF